MLASSDDMHLSLLIFAGALGAVGGDNTAYLLGRYFGEPLRRRFFAEGRAVTGGVEGVRWLRRRRTAVPDR